MTFLIEGFTAGDDLQVEADITGIDTTDPLIKAWMTVKVKISDADPGALQKIITTAAVQGTGQITQDGSPSEGNGTATCIFQLIASETATLGTSIRYYYDIQGKSASGNIYTREDPDTGDTISRLQLRPGITGATS